MAGVKLRSNNLVQLRLFVKASNILDTVRFNVHRSDHRARLLQTIQLLLCHLQLDLSIRSQIKDFCLSQQVVYTPPSRIPLFLDKKMTVNVGYLLHIVNFFKYHMKTEPENTLYPLLSDLESHARPTSWDGPLEHCHGDKLASAWKGSYAYIPDYDELKFVRDRDRCSNLLDMPIPDALDCEGGFQTLLIDSLPDHKVLWPAAFENHLSALPSEQLLDILATEQQDPPATRRSKRTPRQCRYTTPPPLHESAFLTSMYNKSPVLPPMKSTKSERKAVPIPGKDYLQFGGSGQDLSCFHCTGITHKLPPQSGIPGWQRVCMMKYGSDIDSLRSATSSGPFSSSSPGFLAASSSKTSISSSTNNLYQGVVPNPNPFAMTSDNSLDDIGIIDDDCWCYEGIILPGGKIMVGRWWHPLDEEEFSSMGPFIFWSVDNKSDN
ncbi:uncharacterized protein KY384_002078 [Bacidia gigantensis]|uniref:uncharacterized protein n=1 Tax=Bacidia gigantensis TaxID=2732470 RepID=UPI001D03E971|nr:uncharacterized protein KY384_002078 [Bacidia gigantensis]KAG8533295.1 hypothetical protein KY384_002078 [Bacidia gigantensis]